MSKVRVDKLHLEADEQYIIVMYKANSGDSKQVIKLYEKGSMYHAGLENQFKPIVDMRNVATALATVLGALIKINKLSQANYESVISSFEPFIDKRVAYSVVENFIKEEPEWI